MVPIMRMVVLALASLVLSSCADQTAIVLEVTSRDLVVPDDLDQVRFVASAASGVMADRTADLPGPWPQTFALRPGRAQTGEQINIQVFGLRGGTQRVRRVLPPTQFDNGSEIRITVELSRACLDVDCPMDADCISGMCIGVVQDAGVDAGMDADVLDGGVDAPPIDAPVDARDAAVEDGGVDAPPIDVPVVDVFDAAFDAGPGGLIISEYLEGSGNNKAIEIFNAGTTAVDLSLCTLDRYANGTTSPTSIPLSGSLAAGAALVVCNTSISAPGSCDVLSGTVTHNGDDAWGLDCDGSLVDSFGQIGVDPGMEWMGGGVGTLDVTLRRKCTVVSGDTMGSDAFDPSVEWDAFGIDDFTNLGIRSCP